MIPQPIHDNLTPPRPLPLPRLMHKRVIRLAALIGLLAAVAFALVMGIPTLRLRGDYLAIVTLGFGEIVRLLATIIPAMRGQEGFSKVGAPPGTASDGTPLFTNSNGLPWYWLTLTVLLLVMILVGNLERSRVGRSWIAIREDEDAAETMGVPTFKYKVWAFALGAGLGGLSGALFAAWCRRRDRRSGTRHP